MDTKKPKLTSEEKKENNRVRMAKYRKALKSDNEELFLEKQRLTKQKYREKTKPQQINVTNEKDLAKDILKNVKILKNKGVSDYETKIIIIKKIKTQKTEIKGNEKIDELISRMSTINLIKKAGPKIDRLTLEKYAKSIIRLYEALSDEKFDGDLTFLYNFDAVSEYIDNNYKTVGNKLSYYKNIVSFLKRIVGFEEIAEQYAVKMRELKNIYDEDKGKNELCDRESKNYVSWDTIMAYKTDKLNEEDTLLVNLYRYLPPRRLDPKFLTYVKIKNKKQLDELDKNFNYITFDKLGNPTSIIYNNYKTKKRYRQQVFDITQPDKLPIFNYSGLRKSITDFTKSTKFEDMDLFFPDMKSKVYSDFSRRIAYSFRFLKGKEISSNVLRHSFIQYYSTKQLNTNTLKLVAWYMSHSLQEQLEYRRFDSKQEDDE